MEKRKNGKRKPGFLTTAAGRFGIAAGLERVIACFYASQAGDMKNHFETELLRTNWNTVNLLRRKAKLPMM